MKSTPLSLLVLALPLVFLAEGVHAQTLSFSSAGFVRAGKSPETHVKDLSTTGGTVYYSDHDASANDGGLKVFLDSMFVFDQVGKSIIYSFEYTDIRTMELNQSNTIRSGFDFTNANIHFVMGFGGNKRDLRSWFNNTGNEFQTGTMVGVPDQDVLSPTIQFYDGNTICVEQELKLVAMTPPTSYDYDLTVTLSDPQGTASYTFRRTVNNIASNQLTGFYHVTNDAFIEKAGIQWRVANAMLGKRPKVARIPEPSSAVFFALTGFCAVMRKRT